MSKMSRALNGRRAAVWVAALGLLLAAAGPARASEYEEPGVFIMLSGLNAFEHFKNTEEDFNNSWGFNVRMGYRFGRFLALEGSFEFQNGFDVDINVDPILLPPSVTNPVRLSVDGGTGTVNAKGYLPWFGRFQPYGLFGIGGQWSRLRSRYATGVTCDPIYWYCRGTYTHLGNNGAFLMKFGGGAEYWVGDDLALVVDATFNLPTGALNDLRYTSLNWGVVFQY